MKHEKPKKEKEKKNKTNQAWCKMHQGQHFYKFYNEMYLKCSKHFHNDVNLEAAKFSASR